MTVPYLLRLICVCLASFAIVFLATGLMVGMFVPVSLRFARGMRATVAAGFVLGLRLLPAGLATVAVAAICLPSYLGFEQRGEPEETGMLCMTLAALAVALFIRSTVAAGVAWRRSQKVSAVLALVGMGRPRIVVSDAVRRVLTAPQLEAAIRHEQAHAESFDNWKRLWLLLAPGLFPGAAALTQSWKRLAEWAADDRAAGGDPERALALAAALVQVAKLGTGEPSALATAFLANANDLEERVERLLSPNRMEKNPAGLLSLGLLLGGGLILFAMMHLGAVHQGLEALVH